MISSWEYNQTKGIVIGMIHKKSKEMEFELRKYGYNFSIFLYKWFGLKSYNQFIYFSFNPKFFTVEKVMDSIFVKFWNQIALEKKLNFFIHIPTTTGFEIIL